MLQVLDSWWELRFLFGILSHSDL